MKKGRLTQGAMGLSVDVEYTLRLRGPDDAFGKIQIGNDPVPGARFMGDPTSAFPGDMTCILETASGVQVSVFLTSAEGHFDCKFADEARAALDAGG